MSAAGPDDVSEGEGELPATLVTALERACDRFEAACRAGMRPRVEDYLGEMPEPGREALAREMRELERAYRDREADPAALPAGRPTEPTEPEAAERAMARPSVTGYEILDELGRGGMGVVYRARQLRLNRPCALKMIRAGDLAGPRDAIRFLAEAEAAAQLRHPHIVQIYGMGEHDGRSYLELEYVEGGSLARRLDGTPWPPRRAAELIATLAGALEVMHARGIVHRDLKPSNILLEADGTPKISDFGVAKALGVDSGLTATDEVLGTPSYMAPEQARGGKHAGPAADVYALGAILYELLTGRPPFKAATFLETLEQVRSAEPVPPGRLQPRLPRDLETICLKCLEKEPTRRYEAAALTEDLRRFLAGEPIRARPVSRAERLWRWCRRNPIVAGLTASVVTLLIAVTVGAMLAAFKQRRLAEEAEHARDDAVAARVAERAQRRQAEELLERQYVARAVRLMDDGDPFGALPWIVEGLRLVQGDAAREEMHRFRLAAALQYRPRFVHVWFHDGPVSSAAFSPDGGRVVTASNDQTAGVWDAATGRLHATLRHRAGVKYAEFSPDGGRVVTASLDRTARVWDAATGRLHATLEHQAGVEYAKFSPDGGRVVTAGSDQAARVWDAATGRLHATLEHRARVRYAEFSPDGGRVVTASDDRTARVWDAATGRPLTEPLQNSGVVFHAAFSLDGNRVVTASYPTARVWDVATGRRVATLEHITNVNHAAFSPDSRWVVTASRDNTARVWEAATGRPRTPPLRHDGHVSRAAFSPDGSWLATAGGDGIVRVWDAATGQPDSPALRHSGPVKCVAYSPDGSRLLAASDDETARVWDPAGPAPIILEHHGALVYHATFSPDGRRLATASWDRTARIWDAITGRPLPAQPLRHDGEVRRVTFSPDGGRVVTASLDRTARVWDAATGRPVTGPLSHGDQVLEARFSPSGDRVVTASRDSTARVWDAATGRLHATLDHQAGVEYAEFSPDGRRVVTAAADRAARVWDAATGQRIMTLEHSGPVRHAAFNPDGRRIVTASGTAAQVWDAASGQRVGASLGHKGDVERASFSPDDRRVLTASVDGTARVWDAVTGQPRTPPLRHDGWVVHAAFSPDGRRVITASMDGSARVWDAATGEPVTPALPHASNLWHAAFSPDGRRAVTTGLTAQLWELPFEDRPVGDLVLLAQVLTGLEMRAAGQFVPLESARFRADWATLWSRYHRDLLCSPFARPSGRGGQAE
jgi:WD40 repeat protein